MTYENIFIYIKKNCNTEAQTLPDLDMLTFGPDLVQNLDRDEV